MAENRLRRRTGGFVIFLAMALIAGLVFVAVRADGREISRATANDGGAWLVNRGISVVAHRNYATGELSSFVRVTDSPTADVFQSGDLVVVHDSATNQIFEVDTRSFVEDLDPTQLPEFTTVQVTNGALVVTREEPLAVWRLEQSELSRVTTLDEVTPLISSDTRGDVAASPDGRLAVVDRQDRSLRWVDVAGVVSEPIDAHFDGDLVDVTIVDASVALLSDSGDVSVVGPQDVEHVLRWEDQSVSADRPARLQQPSAGVSSVGSGPARELALVTQNGDLIHVDLRNELPAWTNLGSIPGGSPVAPIMYEGCVYGLTTDDAHFAVACDGFSHQELVNAGPNLRLRLVNGVVLVNDVDSGTTFAAAEDLTFQEFDDWGPAQQVIEEQETEDDSAEADSAPDNDDGPVEDDPDADGSVQDADTFNPGETNVPPVAVDDNARTRVDRSVVVDVLANDSDLNNDILVVTDVELLSGSGVVTANPSGTAIQVTPGTGFTGTIQLRYFISDGKSQPVSALVTVEVVAPETTNQPPVAVTDVIATAPGHTTTVDVLANDSDPDGDAIALIGIETTTGTLRWDPIGQVTFTPDNTTSAGWIELPYVITDDLGLEAEGLLRVEIRDDGANQEPDARNDQITTVVGRTAVLNLLENDTDPDGDTLIVGSQPTLLEPANPSPGPIWQTTSDGEFVFRSEIAGTFIFSYTANDASATGGESDTARIRVDVLPETGNKPPIAVRDDVVIATGETRLVNVLANDGDPDGDLVSIVDFQKSDELEVVEYDDGTGVVGFQITVKPGVTTQPTMSYRISDGFNEPVAAPVVVAVVQRTVSDQPPIANDDVVEARAGSTISDIKVLNNDFDPEGGALRVVRIGDSQTAQTSIGEDQQSVDLVIAEDAVASFSIPYDIEDEGGNRAAAVLRVQLINPNAPNRPPIARVDEARTDQGEPVLVNALDNDSDPDNDLILLESINAQPSNGTAEVVDGLIRYAPDLGFSGTDSFRYVIVDSEGGSAIGDVFVGVREAAQSNRPPIANDDSYTLAGIPSTTPLDVLANDTDPDNDQLRVVRTSPPTEGSVAIDEFGRVSYEPPTSLAEDTTVTFTYVIVDTAANTAQATVSIEMSAYEGPEEVVDAQLPEPTPTAEPTPEPTPEVTPTPEPTPEELVNVPPIAVNDRVGPIEADTSLEVDVLANDRDPDAEPGEELSITDVGPGGRIVGDRVRVDAGEESFVVSYTIEDVDGATASANIEVLVVENQPPTVQPLEVEAKFETPINLDLAAQADDPDGDPLQFVCCEAIRGGSLSQVVTSADVFRLTFTPDPDFVGSAGFSYIADDLKGHQISGSVSIRVLDPDNRPPETIPDSVSVPQGETVQVDLNALTSDPDGDALTYTVTTQPPAGVDVQITGATAVVSVDRDRATGSGGDFTYEASDGELSASGTISVEITEGANRPPTVSDFDRNIPAAGSASIDLASLTVEPDLGDSVTFTLDSVNGNVEATLTGSSLQVRPPAESVGDVVSIAFTATDTRGGSDSGVITVTVTGPTSPDPSAVDDDVTTERNVPVVVDVVANDSDPLGLGLTLVNVSAPWGTASVVGNELRFDPGDEVRTALIDYTMRDQSNREATGRATVEVIGAPEQPAPPEVTASSEEVLITWDEPANNGRPIDGYRIYSTGHTEPEVVGRQNSFTWEDLTNAEEYQFSVIAFNEVGDSPVSDLSEVAIPDQLPEAPSPPRVERGDSELTISWDPATSFGTRVNRYEVAISPSTNRPPQQVSANGALELVWEGLDNGSTYTFTVRARNDAGWGDPSASSPEGRPSAPPEAPTIGETTRGNQSATLTVNWANNDTNGAPITAYRVRSSVITTPVTVTNPDARSYDWSGLPNGQPMTFAVRAYNEAGWGLWSDESNQIEACGVPDAPTNVVAVRGDTQVDVTWDTPSNTATCQVTNYTVEALNRSGAVVSTRNSTSESRNMPGLTNGVFYTFRVRATNSIGVGGNSAPSNEVKPAGPPICRSSGSSFTSSITAPRQVDLAWSNLAAENGEPIIDYEIDRRQGAGYESLGSAALSSIFTQLNNGTTYNYDIRAANVVGVSGRCASTSATTWALPSAISVTGDFDSDTEVLTFTISGGNANGVPGGARTASLSNGSGTMTGPVSVPASGIITFDITEDGIYSVSVEATNAAGTVTGGSTPMPITLAAPPATMTASNITLTSTRQTNVDLARSGVRIGSSFVEPNDNGADITEYEYQVRRDGAVVDSDTIASSSSSSATSIDEVDFYEGYSTHPSGVNRGRTLVWEVRARARNSKGTGDWSSWISINPAPPAPDLDFTVVSSYNCTPSGQSHQIECFTVSIDMYGFPANTSYQFLSEAYGYSTRLEYRNGSAPNPGSNGHEHSCDVDPARTDSTGRVSGDRQLCVTPYGAQIRLVTGSYSSPWRG